VHKYYLAKLAQLAGTIDGRKRLQKIVFFLQSAGLPMGAEFALHHFGPYSWDVAQACDELVSAGVLSEEAKRNQVGRQYSYRLTERGSRLLDRAGETNEQLNQQFKQFQHIAQDLLQEDLRGLELGSTILYFKQQGVEWNEAARRACEFKSVDQNDDRVQSAIDLARRTAPLSGC